MIPKEKILLAKHADLPSLLQKMGIDLVAESRGYYLAEHDSLKLFCRDGVWLYKWWSHNGEVGDGIQYLQRHCGMGFAEAVTILSGYTAASSQKDTSSDHRIPRNHHSIWTAKSWQIKSEKLIKAAQSYIWGPNGKERIAYLVNERGLRPSTIWQYRLGWLPAKGHMPSKLLVPCYDSHGGLIRIRFRIDNPKPGTERYRISKGSNSYSAFPIGVSHGKPVMVVESELDAILVGQEASRHVGVLGIGTTGAKWPPAMVSYLNERVPIILISLDNDRGGREKTATLLNELQNAIDWPTPEKYGKDPGEAWGQMSIARWVETGLKIALQK